MTRVMLSGAAVLALTAGGAFAQDLKFAPGEDGRFNWDGYEAFASANDYSGQTLSITGPWTGKDKELVESVIAYFEAATGATVRYSGSDSFEQDVVISTQAGTPPNLAVFPQPGLAADMASQGFLEPLSQDTADWLVENYAAGQSWVDLSSYPGPDGKMALYAFPYKIDVKSLVWYSPAAFDEMGYEIPQTLEELKALTEQIVADGATPWCIGLGSGAATGWPATDWVEDLMLRTQPPEVYDQWVTNEMLFTDERVVNAIGEYGWFARNPDFTPGGPEAVVSTDFRDSPAGLFSFPPECFLHKQATFIPTFFPEGTELGLDADFFYFPAYENEDLGQPVLGAGTLLGITEDSEVTRGFIDFLKTDIAHEIWMAQSGFLTPLTSANKDAYANDTLKSLGEILTSATTFRFDGSDLMPSEIGADAFWSAMVAYTGGKKSAEEAAADVQDRWNSIK